MKELKVRIYPIPCRSLSCLPSRRRGHRWAASSPLSSPWNCSAPCAGHLEISNIQIVLSLVCVFIWRHHRDAWMMTTLDGLHCRHRRPQKPPLPVLIRPGRVLNDWHARTKLPDPLKWQFKSNDKVDLRWKSREKRKSNWMKRTKILNFGRVTRVGQSADDSPSPTDSPADFWPVMTGRHSNVK